MRLLVDQVKNGGNSVLERPGFLVFLRRPPSLETSSISGAMISMSMHFRQQADENSGLMILGWRLPPGHRVLLDGDYTLEVGCPISLPWDRTVASQFVARW